jgi:hypothetical protein
VTLGDGRRLRYRRPERLNPWSYGGSWTGPSGLLVLCTLDSGEEHGPLLHVSLSYPQHHPSWRDIRLVREAFFPASVDVMMVLPREGFYVNVQEHCFHLWETPSAWGMR